MPWAIVGGVIGAGGSLLAGSEQASSANKAAQLQWQEFQQTEQNEQPYLNAGSDALSALEHGLGIGTDDGSKGYGSLMKQFTAKDYHQSPGYQFQLNQGNQQLLNTASATGGVNSGNTLKALTQYGQGLANQDYQQAYNNFTQRQQQEFGMLDTVAGSGQNAAANLGALGNQAAATAGQDIIGAGNANAAGLVGGLNSISGGVNNYLQYQQMQQYLGLT